MSVRDFWSRNQYERLLEELPPNLKALFVSGYRIWAHKNELRRIRWEQVDFDGSLIRLSKGQTKAKRPRTLPICGDMRRWLEHQPETCPDGCPWVFRITRAPGGQSPQRLVGSVQTGGMAGLLFHDLRRSAVRNMKRAGIQGRVAMEITGHRTRSIFDRYNIVDGADLESAGETTGTVRSSAQARAGGPSEAC